jgi:hypothetical protein
MRTATLLVLLAGALSAPACAQTYPDTPRGIKQAALRLTGAYGVEGRNPDGTPYLGTAMIKMRGDGQLDFVWQIGQFQHGIGKLDGNIVTVDFGDLFPAIYEIQTDGSLNGTWGNGKALERLVPLGLLKT